MFLTQTVQHVLANAPVISDEQAAGSNMSLTIRSSYQYGHNNQKQPCKNSVIIKCTRCILMLSSESGIKKSIFFLLIKRFKAVLGYSLQRDFVLCILVRRTWSHRSNGICLKSVYFRNALRMYRKLNLLTAESKCMFCMRCENTNLLPIKGDLFNFNDASL